MANDRCIDCGPHTRHEMTFTDSQTNQARCPDHVTRFISWLLDGGMVSDPDRYEEVGLTVGKDDDGLPILVIE